MTPPVEVAKPKPADANESWAVFTDENAPSAVHSQKEKSSTPTNNLQPSSTAAAGIVSGKPPTGKESPVSSEEKNELKQREKEYQRKWPKHHTSSSSRDVRYAMKEMTAENINRRYLCAHFLIFFPLPFNTVHGMKKVQHRPEIIDVVLVLLIMIHIIPLPTVMHDRLRPDAG